MSPVGGTRISLYVCGPELLRDGFVTACVEGPCQADVPSCRSPFAALGRGGGSTQVASASSLYALV